MWTRNRRSGNIKFASSLTVTACNFLLCLDVSWQNWSVLRLNLFLWHALKGTAPKCESHSARRNVGEKYFIFLQRTGRLQGSFGETHGRAWMKALACRIVVGATQIRVLTWRTYSSTWSICSVSSRIPLRVMISIYLSKLCVTCGALFKKKT
jgi:hypothetical protein